MTNKYYLAVLAKLPIFSLLLFFTGLPLVLLTKYSPANNVLSFALFLIILVVLLNLAARKIKIPAIEISESRMKIIFMVFPLMSGNFRWQEVKEIKRIEKSTFGSKTKLIQIVVETDNRKKKTYLINPLLIENSEDFIQKLNEKTSNNLLQETRG